MTGWAAFALERARRGEAVALVSVCAVQGSAPREAGTRMVVTPAETFGTIGGGALEHQAIDQARKLLASEAGHALQANYALQDWPLGPFLSQCCGGHVRLLIERVVDTGWLEAALAFQAAGQDFTIRTDLGPQLAKTVRPDLGQSEAVRALSRDGGYLGAARPPTTEVGALVQREAIARPRLLMFGAGHVGQAVARALAPLPFDLAWFDSRPEFALPATLADETAQFEAIGLAAPASLYLIFTHSHALDYALTRAVLRRGDARYCGLIGSRTKRARFLSRLKAEGLDDTGLTCPIGLTALTGKAPEVIAVGVAAQLLLLVQTPARSEIPA
ncbi:xanthine dehydrogenase accessory factor [Caulobacter ginsengisoli]|uniref:Xanthine dehydrogenase accessory factor n=1 Tax=Caulobacter ginsengisoli TaxID=400775 RepID=A0ABU0IUK1_9CAUL|nr:xanthine dehydrogenase accessory protein XdhC [Caulobacter ginsengisoli]MDQ0464714.1 xanthine dehydrogenase accessory factor [Caulobacter ginsengisoli]